MAWVLLLLCVAGSACAYVNDFSATTGLSAGNNDPVSPPTLVSSPDLGLEPGNYAVEIDWNSPYDYGNLDENNNPIGPEPVYGYQTLFVNADPDNTGHGYDITDGVIKMTWRFDGPESQTGKPVGFWLRLTNAAWMDDHWESYGGFDYFYENIINGGWLTTTRSVNSFDDATVPGSHPTVLSAYSIDSVFWWNDPEAGDPSDYTHAGWAIDLLEVVPEPSSLIVLGLGGLWVLRRRTRR